ncbi:kinase-like domain-containing protein [Clohesyomyces aquaticus]|uniref:Kinase-like domain-containing protein n=1 Tax=Clohesyomyces aquaticus TaxID=1231657 RepID=A0A1Y2A5K8_9PLEO|nr:kinase-like domain-containing protein [Clohesyomyces aquaticus]
MATLTAPCQSSSTQLTLRFPEHYELKGELGKGGEATIELWGHKQGLRTYPYLAIKCIKAKARGGYHREVEVLRLLGKHKSVIELFFWTRECPRPGVDCLVFPAYPEGDLHTLHRRRAQYNKGIFAEAFLWGVYAQLSEALSFLHEGIGAARRNDNRRTIIHRDIKMENILVETLGHNPDLSSIKIKLADFGLADSYDPRRPSRMRDFWGTPLYWPPEQTFCDPISTPEGDVWAIGAIVHRLAHSFPPTTSHFITKQNFLAKHSAPRYPSYTDSMMEFYWEATTPRQVYPVNLEQQQQLLEGTRRLRWTPRYTDRLNNHLMLSLQMQQAARAPAGLLHRRVEEGRAVFEHDQREAATQAVAEELVNNWALS